MADLLSVRTTQQLDTPLHQRPPARIVDTLMHALAWPAYKNLAEQPYNSLLYNHMAHHGLYVDEFYPHRLLDKRYAVFHLHWPDSLLNERSASISLLKACALLLYLDTARALGLKIIWTVHNLSSHEHPYPRLEAWFWKAFLPRVDGYISLSETGREVAQKHFPPLRNIPGFVVLLGHYRGQYRDDINSTEARRALDLAPTAKVLLFIGKVRPYKNVPQLIRAFRQFRDPDAVLCIAGLPNSPALRSEIETEAAADARVRCELAFVPDDMVQVFLRASDVVVLPYRDILNSGSAVLGLSFDRPVLVPRRGALGDLQAHVGDDWVRTYEGDISAEELGAALAWATTTQRPARAPLDALEWSNLARRTIDAYTTVVGR